MVHSRKIRMILLCTVFLLLLSCDVLASSASAPGEEGGAGMESGGGETDATGTAKAPQATETEAYTPTFTVVHLATPSDPGGTNRYLTDLETKPYAPEKKTIGGDLYPNNQYERPFTEEEMEYLPDVDITRGELRISPDWIYITIFTAEENPAGVGKTRYGVEFDVDIDDRGDYLIWGASPADEEWTTDGVQVWKDGNNDVGGPIPQVSNATADEGWREGDGYDENLFDAGQGADPDMAWIRRLEDGKQVQLAFKHTAIEGAGSYLWSVVADAGVQQAGWFDYNDHFTQTEAGSPLPVQTQLYPVGAMWGLDNTCRDAYGFTPSGNEANLCEYFGSISGREWVDVNYSNPPSTYDNGIMDPGEPGYAGGEIRLGQGACPSSGYKVATTDGNGNYSFAGIPIGTYCVSAVYMEPLMYFTTPGAVTVTVGPNQNKVVNFGVNFTEVPGELK